MMEKLPKKVGSRAMEGPEEVSRTVLQVRQWARGSSMETRAMLVSFLT